jgi:hypothetical protein
VVASFDQTWLNEKPLALQYVQAKITELEKALDVTLEAQESVKSLALGRLESGVKMSLLIALTQLKNTEASRDHLFGVIGSLEHLQCDIEDSLTSFDWKRRCNEILDRDQLRFSVKDDVSRSFDELKEQVHVYCQVSQ